MKNITKILLIAMVLLAFAPAMFALEQTIGLRFGCSQPLNDYTSENSEKEVNWMAGLGYEAWLKDFVSVGIYPYYTNLEATYLPTKTLPYKTQIIGAEIQARFRPTKGAVINFNDGALQRIAPYAQIGVGAAYIDNGDAVNGLDGEFAFLAPTAGLGLSFQTKWNLDFDLGVQLDHAVNDKVETYPNSTDAFLKDAHFMPFVGIGYTFGKKGGSATTLYPRLLRNVVSMEKDFTLDGVQFEFDSAKLTADAKVVLKEVVDALKKNPNVKVDIQGHTDNVGEAAYNITLSQERANAVKDFLVQNGISAMRITTRGYGENRPVASNETAEGRALNRRIDFVIVK